MLKKLQVTVVLLCMLSYAAADTVSIGTVSARGDMRVDSNIVKSNATLFDGSVVETGQATADLRLDKGVEISMSTGSRGTLYHDRLVLQRGESELAASNSFQIEANGLRVTANEPNSRGLVSMKSGNTVEVAALTGSFGVSNDQGLLLASVRPGKPLSFSSMQAEVPDLKVGSRFSKTGLVSTENGRYFVTVDGIKYELKSTEIVKKEGDKVVPCNEKTPKGSEYHEQFQQHCNCKDPSKLVGKTVKVNGVITGKIFNGVVSGDKPAADAIAVIAGCIAGIAAPVLWGGIIIGSAAGIAAGVAIANQSSTPASR